MQCHEGEVEHDEGKSTNIRESSDTTLVEEYTCTT
jgi:hypothetical protein